MILDRAGQLTWVSPTGDAAHTRLKRRSARRKFSLAFTIASALVHDGAGVARLTDAVGRGEIVQRLMDKVEIQTTARFEPNGAAQCRWIASRLVLRKYFQNPEVTFPSELPGRPDKAEAWR